jgi:hypothetical protein
MPNQLLHRGRQCLFIGFFTSWLGIGILFIAAACVIGIIGLCGDRPGKSLVLVLSSIVVGFIAVFVVMHMLAVVGIVAFTRIKETHQPTPAPKSITQPASKSRK